MNTATPGRQMNFTPVRAKTVRGNTPATALQSRCTNTPNPTPQKMMGRTPISGQWTPTTCKMETTGIRQVEVFVDRRLRDSERVADIEMSFPPPSGEALRNVGFCFDENDLPALDDSLRRVPLDVLKPPPIDDISFEEDIDVPDIEEMFLPISPHLAPVSFEFDPTTETPDLCMPGSFEQCSILQPIFPI